MRSFPLIGFALASAIALAGCQATAVGQVSLQKPGTATPAATTPAATNPGTPAAVQPGTTKPVVTAPATVTTKPAVAVGKIPAAVAQASVAAGQEAASALAEEQEMDDYDTLADQEGGASYELMQLGANLGAKAKASLVMRGELKPMEKAKLDKLAEKAKDLRQKAAKVQVKADAVKKILDRQSKRADKLNQRLGKLQDARMAIRGKLKDAAWVDNGDGTATRTIEISVSKTLNGKTFERKAKIVRTRRTEDKVLVLATAEFTQALPGGLTRTSTRSKTLNADGTYTVDFDSLITLPNGATRTAAWDKTIAVDGGVTGTGTITWTDKDGKVIKTVTVTLSGDEDEPKAACEDKDTGAEAEVAVTADGTIDASIGDEAAGTAADVAIDTSADGSVEVPAGEGDVSVAADGTIAVAGDEGGADGAVEADAAATAAAAE